MLIFILSRHCLMTSNNEKGMENILLKCEGSLFQIMSMATPYKKVQIEQEMAQSEIPTP